MGKEIYTIKEVAERWGVSERMVKRTMKPRVCGDLELPVLPVLQFGRKTRIRMQDLLDYERSLTQAYNIRN